MNIIESNNQVKYILEDAMNDPINVKKISDKVNDNLMKLGYSDKQIKSFLLNKKLKLIKMADRMDVVLNNKHLFYVVVGEFKINHHKSYVFNIED